MARAKSKKEVKNDKKAESIKEDKIDPQKAAEIAEQEKIDAQKAAKIVEQEKKARVDQCGREVIMALKKYNCDFDVSVILKSGSVTPNIQIVAK